MATRLPEPASQRTREELTAFIEGRLSTGSASMRMIAACRADTEGNTVARVISRILVTAAGLAVAGFLLLVLIGIWARHEQETEALGFRAPYERYRASEAGFPRDPNGYREFLRKAPSARDRREQSSKGMPPFEE